MTLNNEEINKLSLELLDLYWKSDMVEARQVAERLAAALGEPTTECVQRYVHSWILIYETYGNFKEASRIQNLDIMRKRAEIESGDYDDYPDLLSEEIEYLQDSLFFQAARHEKLGEREKAIDCLLEVYDLARRYTIGPDEDTQALYTRLMASGEGD